jgi:hypothetical protein
MLTLAPLISFYPEKHKYDPSTLEGWAASIKPEKSLFRNLICKLDFGSNRSKVNTYGVVSWDSLQNVSQPFNAQFSSFNGEGECKDLGSGNRCQSGTSAGD